MAANELAQAQDQMVLLGRKTAEEKVVLPDIDVLEKISEGS